MPQPRKRDPVLPQQPAKLTKPQIKRIAKGNKSSEYFLPFCSACTDPCCNGHILATESEHERIVEYSGVDHFKKFKNYYVHEGDPCLYLKQGLCSVHPVRPAICRMFPYYINGDTKDLDIDDSCPAAGTLYASFRPYARRMANKILKEMSWKSFLHFWFGE